MAAEAMKSSTDACPDLETLAAYLDRMLPEGERDRIAAHIASCDTCYFVFTEAAQTHVNVAIKAGSLTSPPSSGSPPRLLPGRWPANRVVWSSAAAALATAAAFVVVTRIGSLSRAGSASSDWQALVTAVGADRPIEPRLSGGFAYGPYRGTRRGAGALGTDVSPDVRIATALIEKRFGGRTDAVALRTMGVAYLVTGEFSRAVAVLEDAAGQSNDAATLSDLAAAYAARGSRENQREDLERALSVAERATVRDPRLAEVAFNRAYAFERLGLVSEARRAWNHYLTLDDSSDWAGEARSRLKRLERDMP